MSEQRRTVGRGCRRGRPRTDPVFRRRHQRAALSTLDGQGDAGVATLSRAASHALAAQGKTPNGLHNNCSGKHAGFVCPACDRGEQVDGYVRPEHPVMRVAAATLADLTGAALDARNRAVDGCGIPTYAILLLALATGFARFGRGEGLAPGRACAARRLRQQPRWIRSWSARAEGVLAVALPEKGLGIAVKCHDGFLGRRRSPLPP